jgi:hypothetical protein
MSDPASGSPRGSDGPAVSVVIPTRNREHLISDAVAMALEQRDVALEVIVVDDASTDGTASVLAGIDDPRLRVVSRPQQGRLAAARNSGIEAARGQWVALLDDDDVWSPDKLRLQVAACAETDAGFAYGGAITVSENLEPLHVWRQPAPDALLRELLVINVLPAGASNVLVRTDVIRELGGFDVALSHTADWDMWIRLAAASKGASVPEVLVAYRLHSGQESDRGDEMVAELAAIESKYRDLRLELGVELDREAFESYAAKRGGGDATEDGEASRPPNALVRARRRLRRRFASGGKPAISSPGWLADRAARMAERD